MKHLALIKHEFAALVPETVFPEGRYKAYVTEIFSFLLIFYEQSRHVGSSNAGLISAPGIKPPEGNV